MYCYENAELTYDSEYVILRVPSIIIRNELNCVLPCNYDINRTITIEANETLAENKHM